MNASDDNRPHVDEDWKRQVETERAKQPEAQEELDGPVLLPGFEGLVQMIVMQALMLLGVLGSPDDEEVPVDLGSARVMIDMLETVQEKTQGNLSAEEAEMVKQHLMQLRMLFVQVQSQLGSAPAPSEPKKSNIVLP
ncbi:MAG: DUF1844 domain-containing protein [Planctomycetales bacterium]|nr:DUF1844 domain-containing protein [Planctomycetales bacterium]